MRVAAAELQRLSPLLDAALALPEAGRAAWLEALPATDAALKPLLQRLLAAAPELAASSRFESPPPLPTRFEWLGQKGERVGPYELLAPLGHGGMGEVWRAARADGAFQREVALKRPRARLGQDLGVRLQFECQVAARLEHRHIARLYEIGFDDQGQPWIASELIDGRSLHEAAEAMDLAARLRLLVWVARAVAYAHGRMVLHRDLKPANVLVDADGVPHLVDFGVAALLDAGASSGSASDPVRGHTPRYAAPEQRAGSAEDVRADVYALGVIAEELCSATANADLAAVIAKARAELPEQRYASAADLADELERCQRGDPVLARPLGPAARLWRRARRQGAKGLMALAGALALLMGGGWALWQQQQARQADERERVARDFVAELFRFAGGASARGDHLLDRSAHLVRTRFEGQPALQAELLGQVGQAYLQMGAAQQASAVLRERLQLRPQGDVQALLDLAQAQLDAAQLRGAALSLEQAERLRPSGWQLGLLQARLAVAQGRLPDAEALCQALEAQLPATAQLERGWLRALRADMAERRAEFGVIAAGMQAAAQAAEAQTGAQREAALWQAALWRAQGARLLAQAGLHEAARPLFDASQTVLRGGGELWRVRAIIETSRFWTSSYMRLARPFPEVQLQLQAALQELQALGPAVPESLLAEAQSNLGWLRMEHGDVQGAAPLLQSQLKQRLAQAELPRERMRWLGFAGWLAALRGEHAQADLLFRERLAVRRDSGGVRSPFLATDLRFVAVNASMAGWPDQGLALLDAAPPAQEIELGNVGPDWYPQLLAAARARLLLDAGRPREALALIPQRGVDAMDRQLAVFLTAPRVLRGEALCRLDRPAAGLAELQAALADLTPARHAQAPVVARHQLQMAACARRLGREREAQRWQLEAETALKAQAPLSPYFTQASRP